MKPILQSLNRIFVIFRITYRESIRRRLVWIFVGSCVFFSLSGACTAKFIATKISESEAQAKLPDKASYMARARAHYEGRLGIHGKELDELLRQEEERYAQMKAAQDPEIQKKRGEKTARTAEMMVVAFCFLLFAGWSYLLAALFTPFIALNDLQLGSHVLLLASPLRRSEYLVGKFLAILGMVLSSLVLMLLTYHAGMLWLYGHPGFAILKALPLLVQGLSLFIAMIILLSLVMGRMPALLLSLAVLFFSAIPAVPVLSQMPIASGFDRWVIYTGFALPQFGVNGLTAMIYAVGSYEEARSLLSQSHLNIFKIGAVMHYYSMWINLAWFVLFGGLSVILFGRKELNT